MSKRNKEQWNVGTLEYWVQKKYFSSSRTIPSFHFSIIPQNDYFVLKFDIHLTFEFWYHFSFLKSH